MKGWMQHAWQGWQCPRRKPASTPKSGGGRAFAFMPRAGVFEPTRIITHDSRQGITSRIAFRDLDRVRNHRAKCRQTAIGLGMDRVSILGQFDRKILEVLGNSRTMRLQNRFLARPYFIKGRKQHGVRKSFERVVFGGRKEGPRQV